MSLPSEWSVSSETFHFLLKIEFKSSSTLRTLGLGWTCSSYSSLKGSKLQIDFWGLQTPSLQTNYFVRSKVILYHSLKSIHSAFSPNTPGHFPKSKTQNYLKKLTHAAFSNCFENLSSYISYSSFIKRHTCGKPMKHFSGFCFVFWSARQFWRWVPGCCFRQVTLRQCFNDGSNAVA